MSTSWGAIRNPSREATLNVLEEVIFLLRVLSVATMLLPPKVFESINSVTDPCEFCCSRRVHIHPLLQNCLSLSPLAGMLRGCIRRSCRSCRPSEALLQWLV